MFKALWQLILALLNRVLGRSPYGHLPKRRIRDARRLVNGDGDSLDDSVDSPLVYVSRHGLVGSGVSCPMCGVLAARAGELEKVVQTRWGEAILCSCRRMLLASPDDDIDPVKPGVPYDESIYHRFVKPDNYRRRQKTLKRSPVVNDWVVIFDFKSIVNGSGPVHDLDGGEGRVSVLHDDGTAVVELAGNGGIGGSGFGAQLVTIPLANIKVMAQPTLHKGDPVRVLRGKGAGERGIVTLLDMAEGANARVDVELPSGVITTVIERVEKIHED